MVSGLKTKLEAAERKLRALRKLAPVDARLQVRLATEACGGIAADLYGSMFDPVCMTRVERSSTCSILAFRWLITANIPKNQWLKHGPWPAT